MFLALKLVRKVPALVILAALAFLIYSGVLVVRAATPPTAVTAVHAAPGALVLSAPLKAEKPGTDLYDRLVQALSLYRARRIPKLYVAAPTAKVSAVEVTWLKAHHVPAPVIVALPPSTATAALHAAAVRVGLGNVLVIVTDAIDTLWAKNAAKAQSVVPEVSPALNSERPIYKQIPALVRQSAGVAVGRLLGYSKTNWAGS